MEREVGGGIGMGNTCKPLAVSFQCMTKSTTNKKKKKAKKIAEFDNLYCGSSQIMLFFKKNNFIYLFLAVLGL